MILSDSAIVEAVKRGAIVIGPWDPAACLGGNSYDVHLGPTLLTYHYGLLDAKAVNDVGEWHIEPVGIVLEPGELYLASTVEYTESHEHVPYLDGKSSVGRLGISIHATAGRGDVDFCGHWTMELSVIRPVRVYAGMPIGQLTWHTVEGEVRTKYASKTSAKYASDPYDPRPRPSAMWKNFR